MKNIKVEKKEKSIIEITGEIPFENLEKKRASAIKKIGENIESKGFRKGKVPEKIIEQKAGSETILREMANLAIQEAYPKILMEKEINPISAPEISITKLASGNPLGFKMTVPVMPEVKLPDYKAIASRVGSEEVKVESEDVEKVINQVLQSKKEESPSDEKGKGIPKLTDKVAKSLGDFKNVEDLKEKVKEGIRQDKEIQAKNKRRTEIIEKIINQSEIDLPEIAIQSELQKMLVQFKSDVERMGMKWQEYLKKIKKNEDDLKKEWRQDAKKRAASQIIINKIAVAEDLIADKDEVEKETEHILSHHKDASPERARVFAEQILTNEKVLKFLEKQESEEDESGIDREVKKE